MKKLFAGFIVVTSMAMISCSHEELEMMNDSTESFTATMEIPTSRTSLGDDGSTVWSDDDAVSVFKKSGYHHKYQVDAGGSPVAILKYANVSTEHGVSLDKNYAVYPYSENNSIDAQGLLTLDLTFLAEQNYTDGTFENGKSVMTAKSDNNELSFFNALSLLRIKLCSEVPGDCSITSIKLTSATQPINGMATVDMSKDKQPAVFVSTDAVNKSTTLNIADAIMMEEACDGTDGGYDFYILVPATTFPANDLTIRVDGVDANGNEMVYEALYPTELKLVRSGITTIHHKFTATELAGTIEPKKIVTTKTELLDAFENAGNIAVIELADNIDLQGVDWTPIGTADAPFNAVLDGKGFTISNLYISNTEYAALIAYAGENVVIKNLTLEDVNINSTKYAAGVVCMADSDGLTIENVKVSGTITATSYAGGIVGIADGVSVNINACENSADVTANRAGGIVAWANASANIENVTNLGDITGSVGASGIAHCVAGTIKNAVNNGDITSNGTEPAAGVAGVQKGASIYEYCFNYGNVISTTDNPNSSAAGILGQTPGSVAKLNYCANYGSITAEQSYAAGIAYSLYGTITASYCYNNGAISGADGAGAIAPKAQYGANDTANFCLNDGSVSSSNGITYQGSNKNNSSYYYIGNDLFNVSDNTSVIAADVLNTLNSGTDNDFFEIAGSGKIVVNN